MEVRYDTREQWIVALVEKCRPYFSDKGYEIPAVRVSCSWPSRSIRKVLGECWSAKASADGSRQIFITPTIDAGPTIAEVLVHELLHGVIGPVVEGYGLGGAGRGQRGNGENRQRQHECCCD